ncbi:hypothetical protein LUX57_45330 [Actinomadura madurae]|uniref:hypothetical protein n=1 Tax=Actinomadura madurae TaxID=1993 RepID=UPI0020D21F8A|nr:hypothetical protein [Actinomadura madurae]MCP9971457.1 hypothetical protein [Actinomadura madurae]
MATLGGQREDLVLALGRDVEEVRRHEHVVDEELGAQRGVLLDVELAVGVADDLQPVDGQVPGLRVRLAVLEPRRAVHADELPVDAEVVEGRGGADVGDDPPRARLEVDLGAAVVGERPRAAAGRGRAAPVAARAEERSKGGGAARAQEAAAGEVTSTDVRHYGRSPKSTTVV